MNRNAAPRASSPFARLAKWLGVLVLVVLLLATALYSIAPLLVARLAPQFAGRLGLNAFEIEVGHPGIRGVDIYRLRLESDQFALSGKSARMEYSWTALREGIIDSLVFAELDVALPSAATSDDAAATDAGSGLLPASPFRQLRADRLTVRFPQTGFIGIGEAELGGGRLSFDIKGIEPELASRFSIAGNLAADGKFYAAFGEPENGNPEFIEIAGTLSDESITVGGDVRLTGYPLALASEFARLPAGDGTVVFDFETQLPWPLPDRFAWQELSVSLPSFAVDWRSADNDLELNAIAGSATLRQGSATATVSGALSYRTADFEYTAVLPTGYEIGYLDGTLTAPAGLRLGVRDERIDVGATLRSLSARTDPAMLLVAEADIVSRIGNLHASGRVNGSLENDAIRIDSNLQLRSDAPRKPGEGIGLPPGAGKLNATVDTRWPLPDSTSWRSLTAVVPAFRLDWKSAAGDLELKALAGSAKLDAGAISAAVSGTGRYRSGDSELSVKLPKAYKLDYKNDRLTAGSGPGLRMQSGDLEASATLRSATLLTAPKIRLDVDADVVAKQDTTSSSGRLTVRATVADTQRRKLNGRLDYAGKVELPDIRRDGRLEATFTVNGDALDLSGKLSSGLLDQVPVTVGHNTATGAGQLRASYPLKLRAGLAAGLLPDWKEPYDLNGGQVDTELSVVWRPPDELKADLALNLAAARAFYEDYTATGISGRLNFRADGGLAQENWRLEPALLQIKTVDAGITMSDVALGLKWSGDRVDFTEARASLLGGTATAAPFAFDVTTGSARFNLALADIDLAAVLALEGDDVSGSGRLHGTLPFVLRDYLPSIEGGLLRSDENGGFIRLSPTLAGAGGRPELTFALVALQDFTYASLETGIDYAQNGDLNLKVRLEGHNPGVERGRPIHYNLNISENVPVLLESLRLQDKLTEGLEKKVKK